MANLINFNRGKSSGVPQFSFGNMLEDFFSDPWFSWHRPELGTFRLDIKEDDSEYVVEADLPGVKKEDVNLDLDNGKLTISVEAKESEEKESKKIVHKERYYRYMERSVYLANAADDGAEAKLDDGELIIKIPKKDAGKSKQKIEIK